MAKRGKSARAQVPLRIPEALRARIERAANQAGMSMNAEILGRLERSFEAEDRRGGPRVVELIEIIGTMMKRTGEHAVFLETRKRVNQGEWLDLPYAYHQATKAANTILKHYKPKGKVTVPKVDFFQATGPARVSDPKEFEKLVNEALENLGEGFARTEMLNREEKK